MSRAELSTNATVTVAPDSVPARLSLVVGKLNRRLALAPGGLSHGLLVSLATISRRGPIRLTEVAAIERVSAPSMTRAVAELESRGLVVRAVDPDDGRAIRVEATQAGLDAILRARAARADVMADLVSGLDPADLEAIEAALPAFERALDLL